MASACTKAVTLLFSSIRLRTILARCPMRNSTHIPGRWLGFITLFVLALLCVNAATAPATSSWTDIPGGRTRSLPRLESGAPGFTLLEPASTGIRFTNELPRSRYMTNQVLPSGSGVTAGDIDGDGWCDLFFSGLNSMNRLYRNLGGWRFEDITEAAGLGGANFDTTGATFADLDGDGDLDLIFNTIGTGTRLWFNDGAGRFTAAPTILNPDRAGMTSTLADVDGDGDLDLYIANYRTTSIMDRPQTRFSVRMINGKPVVAMIDGRPVTDPEMTNRFNFNIRMQGGQGRLAYEENGEPDAFYLNNGQGQFSLVPFTEGAFLDEQGAPLAQAPYDWGLTAMFRDLNGDGHPDLYVCNDFAAPDRIWLNDGKGRFRAIAPLVIRQTSLAAMAVDVADVNRDGFDDLFVTDMLSREHTRRLTQRNILRADLAPTGRIDARPQYPRNTLLLNRGDGTFAEVAQFAGLEASEWSWTPIFLDVDLDGYEDLLIPNGFVRDNMNLDALARIDAAKAGRKLTPIEELMLRREFPILNTRNLVFRNLGGVRFEEMGGAWGFDEATISQGMCLADLDNDGDLDVIVNNLNEAAGIYRNNNSAPRVAVRLRGMPPNTRGIGARVLLHSTALPTQTQEIISGGRYLSGDDATRVFAADGDGKAMRLEVRWRGGKRSVIDNVQANHLYEIDESSASAPALPPQPAPAPVFTEVSDLLGHQHLDQAYDDFERQPLLSKRLSQLGPGVAWYDLDQDGWDDLIVGSGTGGRLAVFLNDGQGGFEPVHKPPFTEIATRDHTAVLAWNPAPDRVQVLVGSANYEDPSPEDVAVMAFEFSSPDSRPVIAGQPWSLGPMALGDVDGDGDLDLFIGGRVMGGRYPEPVSSLLFRNVGGRFELDEINRAALENIGMVSGAVFADLTGNGYPELVLACEWGPIRILANDAGRLREITREMGLDHHTGWWNGINVGDFDGDGHLDLVASNWGRNTQYERRRDHPQRLYYGDLDGDGTVDLITSHYEPTLNAWVPNRMLDSLSRAVPLLTETFSTHEAYARASIGQVLGDQLDRTAFLEAAHLESTVFLNRKGRWESRVLPDEAQFAPAFAVCVADYDGDGHQDLFLSQNFFGVELDTSRHDAGRGLWLQGDGRGGFRSVPGQESGVKVYGEQRGAAVCDYDGDGRVDLVVAQNSASTKLFRNVGGKPGLRVRLRGPAGNPAGIGAVVRLRSGGSWGPAYAVHAGAGYWSQDSAVLVLGHGSATPTELSVQWPGGKSTTLPLNRDRREITVPYD